MSLGLRPLSSSPIASRPGAPAFVTGFSWPMMWEGTGTPSDYVNTDAGDVAGAANPDTLSTYAFSANPALAIADFLANALLGPGDDVNWASVAAQANRCDQDLGGGAKRHTIGVTFDEQRPKGDVEEVLRAAAGCFVAREGPVTYLVADAPVDLASTLHFQPADWQPQSLRYTQRGGDRAPNSVSVRYTNTGVKPWAEGYTDPPLQTPEVIAGEVDELPTVINGTWIQNFPEAVRLQKRYYAEHTLGLRNLEFDVFELGWKVRRGDVIRLSNGVDLVAKPVRVQRIIPLGFARVHIVAQEYSAAMYSDDLVTDPGGTDSPLPDPRSVVAPTGLAMTEELYLDQSQGATVATGAKWLSRFRVTWTHATDLYRLDYLVDFLDGTTLNVNGGTAGNSFVSPAVQQGKLYTARVRTRNVLGFLSTAVEVTGTAQGKLLKPGDVPAIPEAFEIGGEALFRIEPAADIDTLRYEWRYTPNQTAGGSWESATLIDRVDGLRARFKGLPVGTHRFYVKAIDSVGNYSTNARSVDVEVTSDSDAFLQDKEFVSPTLTNMIGFTTEADRKRRWITNHVESWNTLFPLAMTNYPNPVATYGTGNSKFQGESWDLGEIVTGDWTLNTTVTNHGGTATFAIESSDDGSTWTPHTGISWTGSARFVRPVIETTGTMEIVGAPTMSLAAVTRKESSASPVTSLASGAKTINLVGRYVKAVRITITPRGTGARMPTVDNVVLSLVATNSFDVYLFDAAGNQVASDFTWDFEGF